MAECSTSMYLPGTPKCRGPASLAHLSETFRLTSFRSMGRHWDTDPQSPGRRADASLLPFGMLRKGTREHDMFDKRAKEGLPVQQKVRASADRHRCPY
jgi:hypothetical protein